MVLMIAGIVRGWEYRSKKLHYNKNMNYPKHMEEKIRIEVAVAYLQHEFKKLFLNLPEEYFEKINREIERWTNSPELSNPRDFWNGFHGISMGFKLKIGLIYLITAENVGWEKVTLDTDKLNFGVENEDTLLVGDKDRSGKIFREFFENNPNLMKERLGRVKTIRDNGVFREDDPIIVVEKMIEKENKLSVYDGNGRLGRFIMEERRQITAYVAKYKTKENNPINYWLPTSILMDNLYYLYGAIKNKDEILIDSYIKILKDMINHSESGKYEFWERALTSKEEYRKVIEERMGQ